MRFCLQSDANHTILSPCSCSSLGLRGSAIADPKMSKIPTKHDLGGVDIRTLPIAAIEVDAGTNSRPLHRDIVADYAKLSREGVQFPPGDVFDDGEKNFLSDGFHRYFGVKKAGLTEIKVKVHKGTRLDAFMFSLGANKGHGLRPTPSDKRYAVDRTLSEFPDHSDRQVAEMCNVSPTFVGSRRRRQATVHVDSSAGGPRLGKDGKRRRMPQTKSANGGDAEGSPSNPNSQAEEETKSGSEPQTGDKMSATEALEMTKCLKRILSPMYEELRNCTPAQRLHLQSRIIFAATHLLAWPGTVNCVGDIVKIAERGEEYYQAAISKRGSSAVNAKVESASEP